MTEKQRRSNRTVLIVLFSVIAVLYIGFHGKYMAEYLDDAWVMSWAWNLFHGEGVYDQTFGHITGDGGTALFQRTVVFVYGAVASILGWSRGVAFGISKVFILAAAGLWYFIIRKLGYKKSFALAFIGIMLLLEAYYGVANKARQEPVAFFLATTSFLLFLHERYLFSGIFTGIAFEAHPYALTGGFWILAYLLVLFPQMKARPKEYVLKAGIFILGGLLGLGYWLLLHYPYLSELPDVGHRVTGNAIIGYYFKFRESWRHWPELAMILLALTFFIVRKMHTRHPFVLPFLGAVVLASILIPRGNYHYIVYIYPAAILVILAVAREFKIVPWLLIALMLFQLPQYAWLYRQQGQYNHADYITKLRDTIGEEPSFIYGHPNAWFAFQDREFKGYGYFGRARVSPEDWPEAFWLIESPDFDRWNGASDIRSNENAYVKTLVSEWTFWNGKPLRIYLMNKILGTGSGH